MSETRTIFDNRVGNDVSAAVNVYDAIFANGERIEMVVNAEIASLTVAEEEACFYARILGQLDPLVTDGIDVVYINPGMPLMSAFPGGITVHTGWVENEVFPSGAVEEVMAHEAVHATLDPMYLRSSSWAQAQKADVNFVSEYARDFPETEDLAESYGAYLIVKNASRNPAGLVQAIQNGIPERLVFFQMLGF